MASTSGRVIPNESPSMQEILNIIRESGFRQELTNLENGNLNDEEIFIWVTDREIAFTQEKAEKIRALAKGKYGYYIPDIVFIYLSPESLIQELKAKAEKAERYKKTFQEHYGPDHVDYISVHSKELIQSLREESLIGGIFYVDDPNDFKNSNFGEFIPSQSATDYLGEYLGDSNTKGPWQIEIPQLFYSTDEFIDILNEPASENEDKGQN